MRVRPAFFDCLNIHMRTNSARVGTKRRGKKADLHSRARQVTTVNQGHSKFSRKRLIAGVCVAAVLAAGGFAYTRFSATPEKHSDVSSQSRRTSQRYTPSPTEWASLTIEPVSVRSFRSESVTEGKIAVDEDHSTPIFSPYAGRVTKLLAKPGDHVA